MNKIWVSQSHLGYGQSRTPLFLQYVKADATIAVNVGVEDFGTESNLMIVDSFSLKKWANSNNQLA